MFLALQEDTEDTQSSCAIAFEDFNSLYTATNTIIANNSDYSEGLSEKGNGTANDVGFVMYKVIKMCDVVVQFSNLWVECGADNYMLSVGRTTTSFSGFLNTLVNFFWRYWGSEDASNYMKISQAVTDSDIASAGQGFGIFMRSFLMADIASEQTANEDYVEIGYFVA